MAEQRKSNYLRGAAILAATVAVTKIIGMIYKIPLYNLLGSEGTGHFQMTYNVYNLILTLTTAGVPVAISRLIAAAAATGKRQQVKRYFSVGLVSFGVLGLVGMLVMLIFPQQLANMIGDPEIVNGLRVLAPSVFFSCLISVYRGYAQGHENMVPTAISQILEVVSKLVFGIIAVWYLSTLGKDSATLAAAGIVGVTIGLGLAVPVLMYYKVRLDRKSAAPSAMLDVPKSRSDTFRDILRITIPIMLSSSILNIITLVDAKLVVERLQSAVVGYDHATAMSLYGVYSQGLTLFNVPSAFIVPITVSVVPAISAAIARRRSGEAKSVIESSLKITNLIAMPAAVGLCVLSEPIYKVLYNEGQDIGPGLLAVLGIAAFFVCMQLMSASVLQATGNEKLALLSIPVGGIVKIGVNWILVGIPSINIAGAPVGTLAAYMVMSLMNLIFIRIRVPERPSYIKIFTRPIICTAVMGAAAWSIYSLLWKFLAGGRIMMVLCLGIAVIAAVVIYGILIVATGAITREDMKLMPKGEKIANILKIK